MCRILAAKDLKNNFSIYKILKSFATISKNSKEYQGHGWGMTYLDNNTGEYIEYKNINPIWQDNLEQFVNIQTNLLLVHARSAFQDKGIVIENNMPFSDNEYTFIFNGELQGVRIKEKGRIGAEKIFNVIKRYKNQNSEQMLKNGATYIEKRTKYIRALNIIILDKKNKEILIFNKYGEDPKYFQMYQHKLGTKEIVCSEPFNNIAEWNKILVNTVVKI